MGGGDVGFGLGAQGQEGGADLVETGVPFEKSARHLRLPGQTAEIHDSAGMGEDVGAHGGGIDNEDGTGGICCQRRRAGIRGRTRFGCRLSHIHREVVSRDTFGIVVGRGLRWRRVNICFRSARGFILSTIACTLHKHRLLIFTQN
jgi:hypothetical protein